MGLNYNWNKRKRFDTSHSNADKKCSAFTGFNQA